MTAPTPRESAEREQIARVEAFTNALANERIAFKAAFATAYGRQEGGQKRALKNDLRFLLTRLRELEKADEEAAWKWAVADLALAPDEHDRRSLRSRLADARAAITSRGNE